MITSFSERQIDPANATNYTFATVAFGGNTGHTVIGITLRSATTLKTISTVTIDGVAATQIGTSPGNGNLARAAFYGAANNGNLSGAVTIATSGANTACTIGVWNIIGLKTLTAFDSASTTTMTSGLMSVNLTIPAGGGCFAVAYNEQSNSFTWTGADERWDETQEGTTWTTGASRDYSSTTATTIEATCASGNAGSNRLLFAVSLSSVVGMVPPLRRPIRKLLVR